MDTIVSYLKWRGDLNFRERTFCEVDNLALAAVSYLDFTGIVPEGEGAVPLQEVWRQYQARPHTPNSVERDIIPVVGQMAASRRFGGATLSHYRQVLDEEQQSQFAAVLITLDDGTAYLSYRGTDDTLVGWREDFAMGSKVVPAQTMAADYLRTTLRPGQRCYVGGHSKGGNLALYAALQAGEEQPFADYHRVQ